MLYPITYLVALFSLVLWFYLQNSEKWAGILRASLVLGLIGWLVSVGTAEATLQYKMGILFRDLIVLGTIGAMFSLFKNKLHLFLALLLGLSGGLKMIYFDTLQSTFPQNENISECTKLMPSLEGELLIEVNEAHKINELAGILNQYDLAYQAAFHPAQKNITELDDYYLIDVPAKWEGNISTVVDALNNSGLVDWVENNETIKLSPLETSPTETAKGPAPNYGLNDPGVEQLWGFQAMNVDKLYDFLKTPSAKPKRKAIIAILDTGVDANHEDIKANYKSLKSKNDNDPQGHGTHCAGIAASVSNNGLGVASFSHDNSFVQVSSIKVLNSFGMGTQQSIINGIIEAADLGADVISMSLGGPSSDSKQRAYEKAVKYANKKGAIVVVAAGNENRNATRIAPACARGVITVSAIDNELNRAVFSNWVTDLKMGIAAPGVGIYSTKPKDTYAVHSGTSMATPYVAGLVGLMKSFNPDITTKEVYKILNETGSDTKNTDLTGHLIQPVKAIKAMLK